MSNKINFLTDENEDKNKQADDLEPAISADDDAAQSDDQGAAQEERAVKEVRFNQNQVAMIMSLLRNIRDNHEKLENIFAETGGGNEARISIGQMGEPKNGEVPEAESGEGGRIVEGVFDGENMIGPDGKQYSVPANYASKSKLVEGDILKLTITPAGTFIYKQIGPIERSRVIAKLEQGESGGFYAVSEGRRWRVLTASVTYYKGSAGDEVVILVPKTGQSRWAAVDNIVKMK